ncbi:ATP-grasp domain-containing protein [Pseudomonas neustonica]|uniref:ATP-grasp domain-containing protein n=1 Tax=Pseudomonas neustonica TaxID=2487346 RepID=A0ABX9XMK9_9PSED|nr:MULTISPECIES: ATP-grasp domain-containing protein [Pseudomonas]MBA6420465.1 ATP-grasp domain-containing protein [Pseudomonas sp. 5Ae-yellow]ROZ87208.1 ATP-grasp domain-containing protein [Pseudomonas sp. SSM44]ROZ88175.1 ATP-grasp domain-containing protein [Pseudomonas neustonica]|tara:strand:- start:1134 stop:2060 length:927 start_codon:yes stop_codon:yes gene_type:complete
MKVLVSGVAGDIGFGIARVLRDWGYFSGLYGIDIHSDHPGCFVFDECAVAPRATEAHYISWLSDYIRKNKIEVFIPTSEAEIGVLAAAKIHEICGAIVIRNNDFTIDKSLDKYECLSYLASRGIPVPEHGLVGNDLPSGYPVIVKPRSGQGSKGVVLIYTAEELASCPTGLVWQSYLLPDDEEYTCPVYSSSKTGPYVLLMKRKLVGGLTGSGAVVECPEIDKYVRKILECMRLDGGINIQLRLTEMGPLLFEINPRLSSTVVFRNKMGFTDVRWWLADKLGLENPPYSAPKAGTRFYRGSHEYIHTP